MKEMTVEMIQKAREAKSPEELLAMAKENNIEMTEAEAKSYYDQLYPKTGELDDDDLDNIAGGGCGKKETPITYSPIPPYATYVRMINGCCCPSCGTKAGYVSSTNEESWSVSCADWARCKHITGSGRASFWEKFELG